jgi:hypothetical protein|tara:strand:+ start:58 stop:465 length:408 start_codon:yes stop_codon:yes gene_type:complete
MPFKMKNGPAAMYGPKAMKEKGAMAMKEGPMAMKKEGAMAYKKGPMAMSGEKYDAKQAYNKNLTASARLHYLENERHDKTHMSKVQPHKRGATAMHKGPKAMKPKGPMAMKFDSSTDKGIKGLGSAKGEKKAKNI